MKYELKEAIVVRPRSVSTTGPGAKINNGFPLGNQFQVRVLPEMNDIKETDMLPFFPNFFKSDQTAYQKDDAVWLFCTEDFQAGFILGKTQGAAGLDLFPFMQVINVAEKKAGLAKSGFNEITFEGASGTAIRFVNEMTGQAGVIYNNKTVFLYGPNGEIWVNNPGMTDSVSADGDMIVTAKSMTESFTANKSVKVNGESKESVNTKRIETSGMMTLSAGGSRQDVTGANKSESVLGDNQVITGGSYSIGVGPKGLTITSLGPMNVITPQLVVNGSVVHPVLLEPLQLALGAFLIALNTSLSLAGGTPVSLDISLTGAKTVTMI